MDTVVVQSTMKMIVGIMQVNIMEREIILAQKLITMLEKEVIND